MKKNVMLVLVALVTVGIMLASGVGAQLIDGPPAPVPPKVPDKAPAASDEVCEALADDVIAEMGALGGEPMAEEDVIKILRDAEAKGVDIGKTIIPKTGMATSEWGASYFPICPYETQMHVFLIPGPEVQVGLLWDESDNDLDLTVWSCNNWGASWNWGTLTEEVGPMATGNCGPFTWVYVWVDHCGTSCPCDPFTYPTCQYYMLAADETTCCWQCDC